MSDIELRDRLRQGFKSWQPKRPPLRQHTELFELMVGCEEFALLMDPGTAKSYAVVTEASFLYSRGLINFLFVVAPNGVDDEWKTTHLPENCNVPYKVFVWEGLNSDAQKRRLALFLKSEFQGLKVFAVRIDAFSRNTHIELFKSICLQNRVYFVLDEGHVIKNPESNRADNIVFGLNKPTDSCGSIPYTFDFKGNRKYSRKIVTFEPSTVYRRLLTGTLISKSPMNVWAPFQWLKYGVFKTFFAFKNSHVIQVMETIQGRRYNRPIKPEEIDRIHLLNERMEPQDISMALRVGESNVRYLLNNPSIRTPYKNMQEIKGIIDTMSYYCRLEDVTDIPMVEHTIVVPMSENQKRIYKELKRDQIADLREKSLVVTSKIALLTRFSQIASGLFRPTNAKLSDKFDFDEDDFEEQEIDVGNEYELELIDETSNKLEAVVSLIDSWYIKTKNTAPEGEKPRLELIKDFNPFEYPAVIYSRFVAEIELVMRELPKRFPQLRIVAYYGKTSKSERTRIKAQYKEGLIDILVANPAVAGTGLNLQRGNKIIDMSSDYDYMKRKQGIGRVRRQGQLNTVEFYKLVSEGTVDQHVEDILSMNAELSEYFRTKSVEEMV